MRKVTSLLIGIMITTSLIAQTNAQSSRDLQGSQIRNFLLNFQLDKCYRHDPTSLAETEKKVIRAELYCMALRAIGIQEGNFPSLTEQTKHRGKDISRTLLPYYTEMHRLGLTDTQDVNKEVSLSEVIYIILKTQDYVIPISSKSKTRKYVDLVPSHKYTPAVEKALDLNILTPKSKKFIGLRGTATRIDVLTLLFKIALVHGNDEFLFEPLPTTSTPTNTNANEITPSLDVLLEIISLISKKSLHKEKFKIQEAMYDAIKAVVDSLDDRYTVFFDPKENEVFQSNLQGDLQGIGAYVDQENGITVIVAPLENSPAQKAGLQAKDKVLQVNGEDVVGMELRAVVSKIKGPAGTDVVLTIQRGTSTFEVTITRAKIEVPAVTVESPQSDIIHFKITNFNEVALRQLKEEIQKVKKWPIRGAIFDVRNNPGGFLHIVLEMLEFFTIPDTPLVITESAQNKTTTIATDTPIIPSDWKLIVLTNGGSASASEIFAGALQELGLATIIGKTTFGKGTVQELRDFYDDSALKMTIAEWKTGKGSKIDGIGIIPDIDSTDIESTLQDEQLQRAIEEIQRNN